jgi:hypothetical protein
LHKQPGKALQSDVSTKAANIFYNPKRFRGGKGSVFTVRSSEPVVNGYQTKRVSNSMTTKSRVTKGIKRTLTDTNKNYQSPFQEKQSLLLGPISMGFFC